MDAHLSALRVGGGCYKDGTKQTTKQLTGDQVIRENPASRGTETSAEVLVGPPLGAGGWSETPVNSSGTRSAYLLTYLLQRTALTIR
jgi:hypothetical protein